MSITAQAPGSLTIKAKCVEELFKLEEMCARLHSCGAVAILLCADLCGEF